MKISKDDFILLYNQLRDVLKNGTEKDFRNFLVDHINEFPKEIQQKITFLFFEEALNKSTGGSDLPISNIKNQALGLARELERDKSSLEDRLKAKEIEESLQKSDK